MKDAVAAAAMGLTSPSPQPPGSVTTTKPSSAASGATGGVPQPDTVSISDTCAVNGPAPVSVAIPVAPSGINGVSISGSGILPVAATPASAVTSQVSAITVGVSISSPAVTSSGGLSSLSTPVANLALTGVATVGPGSGLRNAAAHGSIVAGCYDDSSTMKVQYSGGEPVQSASFIGVHFSPQIPNNSSSITPGHGSSFPFTTPVSQGRTESPIPPSVTGRKQPNVLETSSFTTSNQHTNRSATSMGHPSMAFLLGATPSPVSPINASHLFSAESAGQGFILKTRYPSAAASFYVDLRSLSMVDSRPNRRVADLWYKRSIRFKSRLRRYRRSWSSPDELAGILNAKMVSANRRRHAFLIERKHRLRRRSDFVKFKVLLLKQQERLSLLRLRAKNEFSMAAATLKRQLIIKRNTEKFGARVEHAQTVAVMQRLKRFMEMKRSLSDSLTELMDRSYLMRFGSIPERAEAHSSGLPPQIFDLLSSTLQGVSSSSTRLLELGSSVPKSLSKAIVAARASQDFARSIKTELSALIDMDSDEAVNPLTFSECFDAGDQLRGAESSDDHSESAFVADRAMQEASELLSGGSEAGPDASYADSEGDDLAYQYSSISPTLKQFSPESIIQSVLKNKELPVHLYDEMDEDDFLILVPLLPPITRYTLRELDMDEILSSVQLRHDLFFDPNLQFKPNTDGERGDQRRQKTTSYWGQVESEAQLGVTYRLPLLLFELRCIILELLPYSEAVKEELEANLDIRHIAQQIKHNVLNASALIKYLSGLLKANCAPARDALVDSMLASAESGKFVESLRICFELMELMKLDYANHQLLRLRPYVVENAVEFEWNWFREEVRAETISVSLTREWFVGSFQNLLASKPAGARVNPPSLTSVYVDGLLRLLQDSPALVEASQSGAAGPATAQLPETLKMDANRLLTFRNDWQDITIMATLLILFRQASGPRCQPAQMTEMKSTLWVLLNDGDTSLSHIVLEMARAAGRVRGSAFAEAEVTTLGGLVERTLAPESRLYTLVSARVGEHLRAWMATALDGASVRKAVAAPTNRRTTSPDPDSDSGDDVPSLTPSAPPAPLPAPGPATLDRSLLARHGLAELEVEVKDLAERLSKLAEFNHATYFEVYRQLYEDTINA
ncbi:hypothetical protein HK405_008609 [Cladochytrium tenue]|nr:hypothetical protein HK405_008609 [Cladochytrium tenue]